MTWTRGHMESRTSQQNRALHKYFEVLAETLNESGLDMKVVLKPSIQIDWTKDTIKEYLWRPIQYALLGKKSTTELLKKEDIDKVFDHLNRHLSEKFGVLVEFPSIENYENKDNSR